MKIERILPPIKLYTFQELKPGDVFHVEDDPEYVYLKLDHRPEVAQNAVNLTTNYCLEFRTIEPQFVLLPDAKLVV